jgi:oxygen-independent coproporphyrinogen-3 oxidase
MTHPIFDGGPYQGYAYAYPHKTAYRSLPRRPLAEVWAGESRSSLFLYAHVPFCTMRCGFCNLFTTPNPKDSWPRLYLDAFRRQAQAVRAALPDASFARFAIGGGTPTYLDAPQLDELFEVAGKVMGVNLANVPIGIEASPDTIDPGKVALLKARGVDRVSIGVQSFVEAETADAGRPQTRAMLETALNLLADADFPTFNIDLIYGLPGQTVTTWLDSLERALAYDPEELYLYPLYVRPLTGLGRSRKAWDDQRLACYRAACELLGRRGYEQASMRMFHKPSGAISPPSPLEGEGRTEHRSGRGEGSGESSPQTPRPASRSARNAPLPQGERMEHDGPIYCCQSDGMVGLGSGARSYTRNLHYSLDYAVAPKGVKGILADYLARDAAEFATVEHGFELDAGERRRRYVLQSILRTEGLDVRGYRGEFGTEVESDFPDLFRFAELGLLGYDSERWFPTPAGLEWSDAIGPWFHSPRVRELLGEYEPR